MIATHNIKVNGRWIHAGEEYEPETVVTEQPVEKPAEKPVEEPIVNEAEVPSEKEEQKAEVKPKTPSRRKATSK